MQQTCYVKWISIVVLFFATRLCIAAGTDTVEYPKADKKYILSYFSDAKALLISPASWKSREWIQFGAIGGAGILAYTQDENLQKFFSSHQNQTTDHLSTFFFEPLGNGAVTSLIIGGFYLGGRLSDNKRLSGTSLIAAKSFITASIGTQIIKHLTHRHRPYQDAIADHNVWEGPFEGFDFTSFPSGHSAAAFSVATVFAFEYRETVWVPILAYTLAGGTAISRLYDNKHWASDVLIGSALGFVTGRFLWKQSKKKNSRFSILPAAGFRQGSMSIFIRLS